MHFPQLPYDLVYPSEFGIDVAFANTRLADDWGCIESGPVDEIHVWVSWRNNIVIPVGLIGVRIWSNDPDGPGGYPVPGQLLWERFFDPSEYTVRPMEDHIQGWFDFVAGNFWENNHESWHQINIVDIVEPFHQEYATLYWLELEFDQSDFAIGWKVAGVAGFQGTALYWDGDWKEMINPLTMQRISLSFVIDGAAQPEGCWLCCPLEGDILVSTTGSGRTTPDFNGDKAVTIADLGIFATCLFGPYDPCCDFDCNGVTDIADFAIFASHYYHSGSHECSCP